MNRYGRYTELSKSEGHVRWAPSSSLGRSELTPAALAGVTRVVHPIRKQFVNKKVRYFAYLKLFERIAKIGSMWPLLHKETLTLVFDANLTTVQAYAQSLLEGIPPEDPYDMPLVLCGPWLMMLTMFMACQALCSNNCRWFFVYEVFSMFFLCFSYNMFIHFPCVLLRCVCFSRIPHVILTAPTAPLHSLCTSWGQARSDEIWNGLTRLTMDSPLHSFTSNGFLSNCKEMMF